MAKVINILILIALVAVAGCAKSTAKVAKSESISLERAPASREAALPDAVVAELALPEADQPLADALPEISSALATEQRVYFPFASDSILPEAVERINNNVEWLKNNPLSYIILEGHCDEVGQSEFNMQLGDRRARAVKAYMIEQGILPERIIMVVSYGSTRPLNMGHRIEDLRDNRRVEFVVR